MSETSSLRAYDDPFYSRKIRRAHRFLKRLKRYISDRRLDLPESLERGEEPIKIINRRSYPGVRRPGIELEQPRRILRKELKGMPRRSPDCLQYQFDPYFRNPGSKKLPSRTSKDLQWPECLLWFYQSGLMKLRLERPALPVGHRTGITIFTSMSAPGDGVPCRISPINLSWALYVHYYLYVIIGEPACQGNLYMDPEPESRPTKKIRRRFPTIFHVRDKNKIRASRLFPLFSSIPSYPLSPLLSSLFSSPSFSCLLPSI